MSQRSKFEFQCQIAADLVSLCNGGCSLDQIATVYAGAIALAVNLAVAVLAPSS